MTRFVRDTHILDTVVVIDGVSGTGKSVLGPILGSFEGVEKTRIEHVYEYVCVMASEGSLAPDAATTMLRLYADLATYNTMVSREVNLRPYDDSGLLNNPRPLTVLRRLWETDGAEVLERIVAERPVLQFMTHQMLPVIAPAFDAWGERLRVLEMVRHPLFLIDHWVSYIDRYGSDPREFSLWIEEDGCVVPWFAAGWAAKYAAAAPLDRTIACLADLQRRMDASIEALPPEQRDAVLVVPFESFVTEPEPWLARIEALVGRRRTPATARALRRQRVPRAMLTAGRGHGHYGWSEPAAGVTSEDDVRGRWERFTAECTAEGAEILRGLCEEYERRHGVLEGARG